MVAKINYGTSLYGVLLYNQEKVEKGLAEILSGSRIISDRLGKPSGEMHLTLLSFEPYLLANRRTEKPVIHVSLSPSPEDRLTDNQLMELAEKYMERLGYGNQPYIVYKHSDTHNVHLHIVSVCVDENGARLDGSFEWRRSEAICRELEREYGMRNAEAEEFDLKAELRRVDVSKGDVRHQIGNTLKAVLESYRFQTFGEYSALLSTLHIEVKQVRGEYNGTPYVGIVYAATNDKGKVVSPPFKSSRFGKRFGWERLKKKMLRHTEDFKARRWCLVIQGNIAHAMRSARSRKELLEMLKRERIDVVFRENEAGRIYGVTFIDHDRREVFNGSRMGKTFSANVFNELFRWWEGIPEHERISSSAALWQSHHPEPGSALEQATGILSLEQNPATDYEEEAFRRRMKRKKKGQRRRLRGI